MDMNFQGRKFKDYILITWIDCSIFISCPFHRLFSTK